MMKIEKGSVVSLNFTLTDSDKNLIESSEAKKPLMYLHGFQNLLPKVEEALNGKATGEKVNVSVTKTEAYGDVVPELIQTVKREQFENSKDLQEGMAFQVQTPEGVQVFAITKINGDDITIDGNHPLAGMDLEFALEVLDIREASKEEMDHGHVHGPGGHEH